MPRKQTITESRNDGLTRRSYVRSLAAVAAATTGAVGTAAAADGADAERIVIDPGEDRTIKVGDGETFENRVIDCTAEGARVTVSAMGTDWTIRNVAVEGELDVGAPGAVFGIADTGGGSSRLENVYLGDGSTNAGGDTAETAIWVAPDHSGKLDIQGVNVQRFPDNAIYASAPGGKGGGTVHIDRCFAANCRVAHYRIGSAGSTVTNSSVRLDDEGYDGRGVWVWAPGPCEVKNCQLETGDNHYAIRAGANGSASSVSVTDTAYDEGYHGGINGEESVDLGSGVETGAEAVVPDAVPTSPGEAVGDD
ncbi:hypothetical protein [Saliphagus sp. LR7]|uniref:hypothetical protein n=1 Tax=Saliphagus sp. LR7 TaxID=2282654 RepID=UPI000DF8285A|nr:hypothetical protein [Saliphagus sp. LR7]